MGANLTGYCHLGLVALLPDCVNQLPPEDLDLHVAYPPFDLFATTPLSPSTMVAETKLYDVLSIKADVTQDEIKKAYR